ncbi:MAG: hypothetical protein QOG06_1011 [Gaiellaceae bacterium]|nr:hypothetical protein [Gaiellaceae bacterium]
MALVDQWRAIEDGLPEGWDEARLRLTVQDEADGDRAAALLGPLNPGRHGKVIGFAAVRRGVGSSPELLRRLLSRLDAAGVQGTLELVRASEAPAATATRRRPSLAEQWDQLAAGLPPDWSDVYAEIELRSSDYLERGALLLAPVNPARTGGRAAYRFRVARRFGYGASAEMARRCFERLDADNIRGELQILRALSDTKPVYTQGPVWYVGGRAV